MRATIANADPRTTTDGPDGRVDLFSDGSPVELLPHDGSAVLHPWILGDDSSSATFDELRRAVEWTQHRLTMFGRQVDEPRLSAWYGDVSYTYSGVPREPLPWNEPLSRLRRLCERITGSSFNSVLANLYRDGTDSMGWHADDEPELGTSPVIASVSLGAPRRFRFRHRDSGETIECRLPSGSLLVMSGACQRRWMHSVPKETRVSEPRINLTYRLIGPVVDRRS